jgi:hypothetical protein
LITLVDVRLAVGGVVVAKFRIVVARKIGRIHDEETNQPISTKLSFSFFNFDENAIGENVSTRQRNIIRRRERRGAADRTEERARENV